MVFYNPIWNTIGILSQGTFTLGEAYSVPYIDIHASLRTDGWVCIGEL